MSCFKTKNEILAYKNCISFLLGKLKEYHNVCSEIDKIEEETDFDTPEKSISSDLESIQECDVFILHYPKEVPTSALVELGFAIAFEKKVIIITPKKNMLPYLIKGISAMNLDSVIIESEDIDDKLINQVFTNI